MNLNCGALSKPCSAVLAHKVQSWVVCRFYLAPGDSKYCRWRNIKYHLNLFLYILLEIYWNDTLALTSLRSIIRLPLAFSNMYLTMPLENPQLFERVNSNAPIQHSAVTAQIQNQHTTKSMLPTIDSENLSILDHASTEIKGDISSESQNVSKRLLKSSVAVLSEGTSQLNQCAKGAGVGMCGQEPAGLHQDFLPFKSRVSFIFGFPGKFAQNVRKQNKKAKVSCCWQRLPKPAEVRLQLTEIVLVCC